MISVQELVEEGIAALKSGDRVKARALFREAIFRNPREELAWLWMSGVISGQKEQHYCLERVLAINPNNLAARKGLEIITANASAPTMAMLVETFSSISNPAQSEPAASNDSNSATTVTLSIPPVELIGKPEPPPFKLKLEQRSRPLLNGQAVATLPDPDIAILAGIDNRTTADQLFALPVVRSAERSTPAAAGESLAGSPARRLNPHLVLLFVAALGTLMIASALLLL